VKIISFPKKISSLFQYSERPIASTETNDTLTESSDSQLFGARKFEGLALSGGLHAYLPQKDIEKKVNLMELSQDAKSFFLIAPILFIYYEQCMPIDFELQQGLFCVFTNCQTYPISITFRMIKMLFDIQN
jgi:hypothetical protein